MSIPRIVRKIGLAIAVNCLCVAAVGVSLGLNTPKDFAALASVPAISIALVILLATSMNTIVAIAVWEGW